MHAHVYKQAHTHTHLHTPCTQRTASTALAAGSPITASRPRRSRVRRRLALATPGRTSAPSARTTSSPAPTDCLAVWGLSGCYERAPCLSHVPTRAFKALLPIMAERLRGFSVTSGNACVLLTLAFCWYPRFAVSPAFCSRPHCRPPTSNDKDARGVICAHATVELTPPPPILWKQHQP